MDTPIITILVATHNRAKFIGEALRSAQLQTFTKWELLVLDDASTDNTQQIVKEFTDRDPRIRYIRHPQNMGIALNRNSGLDNARGQYIAILDSDDAWLDSEKLEKQLAFLEAKKQEKYAMVGSWLIEMNEEGTYTGSQKFELHDDAIRQKILRRNQFAQSSLLYRRDAIREAHGYSTDYIVNDDYDLWLGVGQKWKFANLPQYMMGYRVHSGGITKTRKVLAAKEHLAIIKKYREDYPGYTIALIKAYLRILKAYI